MNVRLPFTPTHSNLETLWTMTGTYDETWFDIVSVSVEVEGGAALQPLLNAMQAAREDDLPTVVANLKIALSQLQKVSKQLGKKACHCFNRATCFRACQLPPSCFFFLTTS